MYTRRTTEGISASTPVVERALAEQEAKLVFELLRLYRDGSSVTVIAARLRELRELRTRMHNQRAVTPTTPVPVCGN